MAKPQSQPSQVLPIFPSPLYPIHLPLPKPRFRFLYFYLWSQLPYAVNSLSCPFFFLFFSSWAIWLSIVLAWSLSGRGTLSKTKRSLREIRSIFVDIQLLSRSPPPRLPPIPATWLQRTQMFNLKNLCGTPFLPGRRRRFAWEIAYHRRYFLSTNPMWRIRHHAFTPK